MFKPAFSTVACPEWTLSQVAERARGYGFEAVELRTFGDTSGRLACEPALSSEAKVRRAFLERGVEILSLGTGVRFDAPIWPPVIGLYLSDREQAVREGKRAVDLAVGLECPIVRVFGFDLPGFERRKTGVKRVADRLAMVVDHADKHGVKVALENGGDFGRIEQVLEVVGMVGHNLAGVSYSLGAAIVAGEDPIAGLKAAGDKLFMARVKDAKDGVVVPLGEGELPCERFVRTLVEIGFDGPVVYEWDRLWEVVGGAKLAGPETVLPAAAKKLYEWCGAARGAGSAPAVARAR